MKLISKVMSPPTEVGAIDKQGRVLAGFIFPSPMAGRNDSTSRADTLQNRTRK